MTTTTQRPICRPDVRYVSIAEFHGAKPERTLGVLYQLGHHWQSIYGPPNHAISVVWYQTVAELCVQMRVGDYAEVSASGRLALVSGPVQCVSVICPLDTVSVLDGWEDPHSAGGPDSIAWVWRRLRAI